MYNGLGMATTAMTLTHQKTLVFINLAIFVLKIAKLKHSPLHVRYR